jgi:hypothetical protein
VSILQRDVRASDHDREAAVASLKAHYADGRLSDHELAARSDAAYRALGVSELTWLTSDLPTAAHPRRRMPVVPIVALLVLAIAAWLVVVPPEITLVLLVLGFVTVLLFSPLWIPALLAFMAYRLIRSSRRPGGPMRAGWR